ncbi:hypothetical protein AB6A40_010908 [Gnathostoma spinigerum]|uniref:Uncharacterized protein n=1 Tax=Gnathostoma spinigerum TaxID=75299 RepID=A0ABD6F2G6_9BILA
MVRSKQMSELAGVMDGQLSDQPTLKRFSRFNQSMHSRVPPSCFYEPTCSHSQPIHSQTYSKGGKLKTSIFGGNWTLRERKDHRPSVHNIVVKKE